jgi:hypothetical protein
MKALWIAALAAALLLPNGANAQTVRSDAGDAVTTPVGGAVVGHKQSKAQDEATPAVMCADLYRRSGQLGRVLTVRVIAAIYEAALKKHGLQTGVVLLNAGPIFDAASADVKTCLVGGVGIKS